MSPQVLSEEISSSFSVPDPIKTTANQATAFTDNNLLNQSLTTAEAEGIIVVADPSKTFNTRQEVENHYQLQIENVNKVVKEYQAEKANYSYAEKAYQDYQEELKKYEQEAQAYQTYLTAEEIYQSDYKKYQKELNAHQAVVSSNQELEKNYQSSLIKYRQEEIDYQSSLNDYQTQIALIEEKRREYQNELADFEKALAEYTAAKVTFDKITADNKQLLSEYDEKLKNYKQLHKEWELEKALYEEKRRVAEANTKKDGHLSQVHAQYLIFKNEPNSNVTFEGVKDFFGPNHDFGQTLSGIAGNPKSISTIETPHLAKGVGGATAAGAGDGYGLLLKQGQPITVTYSGLEKSSYKGRAITKVVYTFELTSTFSPDKTATAFIYKDPTKTIYIGQNGKNEGNTDFTIHQTIRYYYNDNEQVTLDEHSSSLLSLSSLNHTLEFGEQEYVKLSDKMTFIPITGSSVSSANGIIASLGSNNSKADGSVYNRSEWDMDGHDNEYFGAGVAKISGSTISFDFGIRYSQDDIKQSANPTQLRNSSRL